MMIAKRTAINDESASDLVSSLISNAGTPTLRRAAPRLAKSPEKITPLPSTESHVSLGSATRALALNTVQIERFRHSIEEEYEMLQKSEAGHCCHLNDRSRYARAHEQLEKSINGTFFVRPIYDEKLDARVRYFLHFVCQKKVVNVPICCDSEHRSFWFLSGAGNGSEVKRTYSGIDVLIRHKQENHFFELEYPFQISLYRPMRSSLVSLAPLPDQVCALGSRSTILHELAARGLSLHFNELIRASKNDADPLREKCLAIANKINGKNANGRTPLILAIQGCHYGFVELLLDNKADVNRIDSDACSPLHHACRQANPRLLKKLIDRQADPHYVNQRETNDGTYQSHLSAFHYLAMANKATTKNIQRCVTYLLECGCPLMPLTRGGRTPFDIAELWSNHGYLEGVKKFCAQHQFNYLPPMAVASTSEARTILSDLACPNLMGKVRSLFDRSDKRDCLGYDRLFLLYKTKKSRSQPQGQLGICLHHNGQIFVYPISQQHRHTFKGASNDEDIVYKYSLVCETSRDDAMSSALFKSCEELIYSHTKHPGILASVLESSVRKEKGEIIIIDARKLLLPTNESVIPLDDPLETEDDEIDVSSIKRLDLSKICQLRLVNENHRRCIWSARMRLDAENSFPLIIKDYLPIADRDLFKVARLNEFSSRHASSPKATFEFDARAHAEHKHESKFLLRKLAGHPFIVHAFQCASPLKRDLRIFMEYLPGGNLHEYLINLNPNSFDPWNNACHWIYQLAQAMAYLSSAKIVHRDLAARNLLLRNEQHIKLSDFGLSRDEGMLPEKDDCILSPCWTAPECFDGKQRMQSSADVWAFGIVIWEIYSLGAVPYRQEIEEESGQLIRLLKKFLVDRGRRLSRPENCPTSMYDLMFCCWNQETDRRPRFVDLINDFNGMSSIAGRLVQFNRDERRAWTNAKEKYLSLRRLTPDDEPDYVCTLDNENNDEKIVTEL